MPRDTQPLFTQNQHLLILGCGYLGQHVAREAQKRGMRVTALTRNEAQAAALRAQGLAAIVADLASDDWHALAPREVDYVLNCVSSGGARSARAAPSAVSASEDKLAARRRSYVDGMRSLTRWMQKAERVGTVVYTSSTGVYPQGGGAVVDEDAPVAPPDTDTRAGILTAAEQILQRDCLNALSGCSPMRPTHAPPPARTRWFILRLAGLYGPGRSHLLDQVLGNSVLLVGAVEQRLNLIHVEDAAAAIWAAFAAPAALANRVYNVADDAPAPKREVLTWLAAQVGNFPQLPSPVPKDGLPRSATASRTPIGKRSLTAEGRPASVCAREQAPKMGEVTDRRRVVPDRVIANARIKRELGWQPRYPDYRAGYARLLSP